MIREYPLPLAVPMVRAVFDERKTQVRSVLLTSSRGEFMRFEDRTAVFGDSIPDDPLPLHVRCRGMPGDRLWVQEAWALVAGDDLPDGSSNVIYQAHGFDCSSPNAGVDRRGSPREIPPGFWRRSVHMPRWASRITLEVTEVRAERLQEIAWSDIRAEGVSCPEHDFPGGFCCSECDSLRSEFASVWDKKHGRRAPWSANPWVLVRVFRRIRGET